MIWRERCQAKDERMACMLGRGFIHMEVHVSCIKNMTSLNWSVEGSWDCSKRWPAARRLIFRPYFDESFAVMKSRRDSSVLLWLAQPNLDKNWPNLRDFVLGSLFSGKKKNSNMHALLLKQLGITQREAFHIVGAFVVCGSISHVQCTISTHSILQSLLDWGQFQLIPTIWNRK